jgi:hypothetical protein
MFTFVQQKMGLGGRTGEYAFEMLPKIIQDSLGASGKNLQALAGLGPEGDKNLALYEGANFDIKAGKSDLAAAKNKRPYLELAEGNAQSDLEAARRAQEKNRDDVRTLQDKLKETAATNEIKEGGARSDLGMHKANNELEADRGIADNLLAGKGATSADQKRLIDAASLIAGHQVNLGTAAQIIENGAHNVGIFMNQVDRLATVFQKLNPAQRTDLDAKIDALQRQVAAIAEIGHR